MKPSNVLFNNFIQNRDKFGFFVRERRTELGMSLREFARQINLSPAYISDIENGNRYAPQSYLDQVAKILHVDASEIDNFYDLAGCTHSNWPDINDYLSKHPQARQAIRLARDAKISGEEFFDMVLSIAPQKNQTNDEPVC